MSKANILRRMQMNWERQWLLAEFERRKNVNRAYSLRSFSRAVKVSPGRLSEYLAGKRPLSAKMAVKIAGQIGVRPPVTPSQADFRVLAPDVFSAIADWQHYAILSLMETKNFRSNEKWIARRLNISSRDVTEILARLVRVGLVERDVAGQLHLTGKNLTTSEDVLSPALRRSHKQSMEQAISALEEVAVELRDISSITMAIDISKINEAKNSIRAFRRRLSAFLESGERTEVYNLNIQLVPVTRKG